MFRRNKQPETTLNRPLDSPTPKWKEALYQQALKNLETPMLLSGDRPETVPTIHGPLAEVMSMQEEPISGGRRFGSIILKQIIPKPAPKAEQPSAQLSSPPSLPEEPATIVLPRTPEPEPALAWSQPPEPVRRPAPDWIESKQLTRTLRIQRPGRASVGPRPSGPGRHRKPRTKRKLLHFR